MRRNQVSDKSMDRENLEIDLQDIFMYLLYRCWVIILAAAVCAGAAFGYTTTRVEPTYQADTMLYVNASMSMGDVTISASDVGSGSDLISTYIVILKTRTTLQAISDEIDNVYSRTQLSGMISAAAVGSTDVLQVKVTSTDPEMAEKIATAVAVVLPEQIATIIDGTSVRIVDTAVVPSSPIAPDVAHNTGVGAAIGAFISVAFLVLRRLLETKITSVDYLKDKYDDIPLLAVIPIIEMKKE